MTFSDVLLFIFYQFRQSHRLKSKCQLLLGSNLIKGFPRLRAGSAVVEAGDRAARAVGTTLNPPPLRQLLLSILIFE
ncbi:hypothetical protein EFO61_14295 [Lacticaseibacillus rhamnosus]|nr:hypothetical protein [Lacticaseibacillus rhamnosus]MCT3153565.1 hypothetical protein [Lacticaseibacillus rhamnosus]MCT3163106.1 hypothetical protein [Lacticaseibacillus rhamnosus]MCT3165635.1 hypothetical protein [Lacticaseibacillus rhamnosus]MCT3176402.1 hypothetical protein [Lacticaseibacillus rhamnosus]